MEKKKRELLCGFRVINGKWAVVHFQNVADRPRKKHTLTLIDWINRSTSMRVRNLD